MAPDSKEYDLSVHFEESNEYINEKLKTGNVFVHCYHGISRSACLTIAYLIKMHGYAYQDGLEYVMKRRGIVNPNIYFLIILENYADSLSKKKLSKNNSMPVKVPSQMNYEGEL